MTEFLFVLVHFIFIPPWLGNNAERWLVMTDKSQHNASQEKKILLSIVKNALESHDKSVAKNILNEITNGGVEEIKAFLEETLYEQLGSNTLSSVRRNVADTKDDIHFYPDDFRYVHIRDQIAVLAQIFELDPAPTYSLLDSLPELPGEAESWYAIVHSEVVSPVYWKAIDKAFDILGKARQFVNTAHELLDDIQRFKRTDEYLKSIHEQQQSDILLIPAQFGKGKSGMNTNDVRENLSESEYALGVFECVCMLMTHPKRLHRWAQLQLQCAGDYITCYKGDSLVHVVPQLVYREISIDTQMPATYQRLTFVLQEEGYKAEIPVFGTPTAFRV